MPLEDAAVGETGASASLVACVAGDEDMEWLRKQIQSRGGPPVRPDVFRAVLWRTCFPARG